MSHRPGHVDNPVGGTYSMNRRKYLKALTVGAVAAGAFMESCSTEKSKGEWLKCWGMLSLYDPRVTTIAQAKQSQLPAEADLIQVPFYNSNEIDFKEGDVVGFHLLKIGNPPAFVIATNLILTDHDASHTDREFGNVPENEEKTVERNRAMDDMLRNLCYQRSKAPCGNSKPAEEQQKEEKK